MEIHNLRRQLIYLGKIFDDPRINLYAIDTDGNVFNFF